MEPGYQQKSSSSRAVIPSVYIDRHMGIYQQKNHPILQAVSVTLSGAQLQALCPARHRLPRHLQWCLSYLGNLGEAGPLISNFPSELFQKQQKMDDDIFPSGAGHCPTQYPFDDKAPNIGSVLAASMPSTKLRDRCLTQGQSHHRHGHRLMSVHYTFWCVCVTITNGRYL